MRRRRCGNPDTGSNDLVDLARRFGVTVEITTGVGDGFPDHVFGWRGWTFLVEMKAPGKGLADLEDSQVAFLRRWGGGPVILVTCPEDITSLVQALDVGAYLAGRDLRKLLAA